MYLHCRRCGARTPGWETSSRVPVILTQPPPLRLLLADPEKPSADVSLRLLLADPEPGMSAAPSLRLLLADTDALPLGELNPQSEAELSVRSARSSTDSRLVLE